MLKQNLIKGVEARLREEWGIGIGSIPADRLQSELSYARKANEDSVTVKIPSRSEFEMSIEEAEAVLSQIR